MLKDRDGLPMPEQPDLDRLVRDAERAFRPTRQQWTLLVATLRWAQEIGQKEIEAPGAPPGSTAPRLALAAILRFLTDQHGVMSHGAAMPLYDLQAALTGLSDGVVPPMFKPSKRQRGIPRRDIPGMVLAVQVMTLLMDEGQEDEDTAAQRVGRAVGMNPKTLKNFRNRLNQAKWRGKPQPGVPQPALDLYTLPLPADPHSTPQVRADKILNLISSRWRAE